MAQEFNLRSAEVIRSTLAPLATAKPVDGDSTNEYLKSYFNLYGFAGAIVPDCQYRVGLISVDRKNLVGHHWQLQKATATAFVVHGLFDHVGIYLKLVKALLENNFSVLAIDLPGHGLSEGDRAAIDDFNQYSDAIAQSLELLPPGTVFGVGQSTGGSAIMQYVFNAEDRGRFKKIALLAPLIRPSHWPWVNISHAVLSPFMSWFPRFFSANSHDMEFVTFLVNDPLQPRHISVRWVGAMKAWIRRFNHFPVCPIPTLVVQGTSDKTVDWKQNLKLMRNRFSRLEIVKVEGAKHHLVDEGDAWRKQVYEAVLHFLKT